MGWRVDGCQRSRYDIGTSPIFKFAMTREGARGSAIYPRDGRAALERNHTSHRIHQSGAGKANERRNIFGRGAPVRFSPTAISGSSVRMSRKRRVFLGSRTSVPKSWRAENETITVLQLQWGLEQISLTFLYGTIHDLISK
jgi:hypothetical protein